MPACELSLNLRLCLCPHFSIDTLLGTFSSRPPGPVQRGSNSASGPLHTSRSAPKSQRCILATRGQRSSCLSLWQHPASARPSNCPPRGFIIWVASPLKAHRANSRTLELPANGIDCKSSDPRTSLVLSTVCRVIAHQTLPAIVDGTLRHEFGLPAPAPSGQNS